MIIVCEILNDYIVGIFDSELNAIKGIFDNLSEEMKDDDTLTWECIYDHPVKSDFRFFEVEVNQILWLYSSPKMKLNDNIKEITFGTYRDLYVKHRELRLGKILD